ncbi:MAG: alkaline phosphatase family protein [Caldilineaceae bacterium]
MRSATCCPDASVATTVDGPTLLYFGDLVQTPLSDGSKLSFKSGVTNRLGFTDDSSADMLVHMLDNDVLPDLTVAYFPGNDMRSHEVGPERALNHLDELDQRAGEIWRVAFGGFERMLDRVAVVLTGDHSQSDVLPEEEQPGIRLDELLESFQVADAGTAMSDADDLVVCPNLRAAQIYYTPRQEYPERVGRIDARRTDRSSSMEWRNFLEE